MHLQIEQKMLVKGRARVRYVVFCSKHKPFRAGLHFVSTASIILSRVPQRTQQQSSAVALLQSLVPDGIGVKKTKREKLCLAWS